MHHDENAFQKFLSSNFVLHAMNFIQLFDVLIKVHVLDRPIFNFLIEEH